jgi:hypothetical protein
MTNTQVRWISVCIIVLMTGVLLWILLVPNTPRVAAEDEQPTHRVRVWCPDRKGHIDLRLPGFAQSVVIDVAAACGTTTRKEKTP